MSSTSDEPPSTPAFTRPCAAVILAAGPGTRMKSRLLKMLHRVAGQPMIDVVLAASAGCAPTQTVMVLGHGSGQMRRHLATRDDAIALVTQAEQLGTGHAVGVALPALDPSTIDVMVLFGDHPLVTPAMVAATLAEHRRSGAVVTMAVCTSPDGGQHGRLTRDAQGRIVRITEARDIVDEAPGPKEVNSGIHCFRRDWLETHLPLVPRQPHGEYYLTDLIALAAAEGRDDAPWPVAAVLVDYDAAMGVNNRVQLAQAERIARQRINEQLMLAGVTILDPASTFIDAAVRIGRDTSIAPYTIVSGQTTIGEDCRIGPGARISDSTIADRCSVVDSTVESAEIAEDADVGPYAHLRPGAHIGPGTHIGNFAEVKNSALGAGVQMGHMSYLGDATVGAGTNIGAGVVTCNYDGQRKHPTTIGANAFIGSDTMLVAPVDVGDGAVTGAGSVVNRDVPAGRKVVGVPARPIPASLASSARDATARSGDSADVPARDGAGDQ